jgi:hypothetical protein
MLVAALGLLLVGAPLSDSIMADLESPIYAVREKARDVLRASFVPTDRTKWDGLAAMLKEAKGKSSREIVAAVSQDFGVQIDLVYLGDVSLSHTRLDRDWVLDCRFEDDLLVEARLLLQPPEVNPDPPLNYTGVWRVYGEDGSLESEFYYMHGKPSGPMGDDGTSKLPPPAPEPEIDNGASQ